jgi:hypothetical protein
MQIGRIAVACVEGPACSTCSKAAQILGYAAFHQQTSVNTVCKAKSLTCGGTDGRSD